MANTFITQRNIALAAIDVAINTNGSGLIDGVRHNLNERAQTDDAYLNLTPHDGMSYKVIRQSDTEVLNGDFLYDGLVDAATLTPNSQPLSATNQVTVLVPPGVYDIGNRSLPMSAAFVNISGMTGNAADVMIKSSVTAAFSATVLQSAVGVRISNLSIMNTSAAGLCFLATVSDTGKVLTNIVFEGNTLGSSYPTEPAGTFAGEYTDVITSGVFASALFGDVGSTCSGTFIRCKANDGLNGFAYMGSTTNTAVFKSCYAASGFGSIVCSGMYDDCDGDTFVFGANGNIVDATLTNCRAQSNAFGMDLIDAASTLINCKVQILGFGLSASGAIIAGRLIDCEVVFGAGFAPYRGSTISGYMEKCIAGGNSFCGSLGAGVSTITSTAELFRCTAGDDSFAFGGQIDGSLNTCIAGARSFSRSGIITGTLKYCVSGDQGFCYDGDIQSTAVLEFCKGGDKCFAASGVVNAIAAGTFRFCIAASRGFAGAGFASGIFEDCIGGDESFGGNSNPGAGGGSTGLFTRCRAGILSFGSGQAYPNCIISGRYIDCVGGPRSFGNIDADIVDAYFLRCIGDIGSFKGVASSETKYIDCIGFEAATGTYAPACFGGKTTSATYIRCIAGDYSFSGQGPVATLVNGVAYSTGAAGSRNVISATYIDCQGGAYSFAGINASSVTATASIIITDSTYFNCTGGSGAFGGANLAASAFKVIISMKDVNMTGCRGGKHSYAGQTQPIGSTTDREITGVLRDCEGAEGSFCGGGAGKGELKAQLFECRLVTGSELGVTYWQGKLMENGAMHNCEWVVTDANEDAIVTDTTLTYVTKIFGCTIRAGAGGTAIVGTGNTSVAHCRMNTSPGITGPTNNLVVNYNIEDPLI